MKMANVKIVDNGSGFMVEVDGLIVTACCSLGSAWEHIKWMYEVASQVFTVGKKCVDVRDWIEGMKKAGYLD